MLTKQICEAYNRLSNTNHLFLEYIRDNPDGLKKDKYRNVFYLNNSNRKLQSWPIFISGEFKNEMQKANVNVLKLIKNIPSQIFNKDINKISDYYGIPIDEVQYQLENLDDILIRYIIGRGDFIFSESGIKLLEFNVTANMGGWDAVYWEKAYISNDFIAAFLKKYNLSYKKSLILEAFFDHIVKAAKEYLLIDNSEINIAIVDSDYLQEVERYKAAEFFFNQLFKVCKNDNNLSGIVQICDYSKLYIKNGYLYSDRGVIHVLIEMNHGNVPKEITTLMRNKKLLILNGPATNIMSNKLSIAALSENSNSNVYTKEERDCINSYIPWTRKMQNIHTTYKDNSSDLKEIVIVNQNVMVIKKAQGLGGSGVYLGKAHTKDEWGKLVIIALNENGWLVQEYIESYPFMFQVGEKGYAEHDVVWGAFIYGENYVGNYIRLLPKSNINGIVNAHQGAESSVAIEILKQVKEKLENI